jgi:uncharacterized RDD family membrane protein YckC
MHEPAAVPASGPGAGPPPPGDGPHPGYGPPPGYGPQPGYGPPPGYGPQPGYGPPAGHAPGGYPPAGYRPAQLSPAGQPLAGFGDRLAAYLIDMALVTVTILVVFIPVFFIFMATRMPDFVTATDPYAAEPDPSVVWEEFLLPLLLLEALLFLVVLAAYYVYHVELMWRTGQTLGKKVLKIRVVPLDPSQRLTRGAAAKRYAVAVIAGSLIPLLNIIDGLWQLWDKPFQQTLHDKAADTVVVKDLPGAPVQVPA